MRRDIHLHKQLNINVYATNSTIPSNAKRTG
jgi:hypothetical protein